MTLAAAPELSVVVPVYRTAWALPELARRVRAAAAAAGLRHELIVVDDASPDGAAAVAAGLALAEPALRYLPLAANVGQHRAVLAGLAASRGAWVVVMDGDLQDPPEAIPRLLARAREGYDAVFAARAGRYQSRGRMLTSRLFKRALARVAGVPPGSGMFFLASRRLVDRVLPCADPRPFVVALVGLAGLAVTSLPVERAERPRGGSAYSGWRRLRAGLSALAFARRERRRRGCRAPRAVSATAALAVAVGCLAVLRSLLVTHGRPLDLGDEGFRYLLSRSWADGDGVFEGFQLLYVPGQYVYLGSFLRLFGRDLETLRLAEALLGGAAAAVLVLALARVVRLGLVALAGVSLALLAVPGHATLASSLVLALAVDLAARRRVGSRWVFGVAALAGVLAAWREDSAVLMLALAVVAAALRRRPRDVAVLVLPGVALGLAPWVAAFALAGEGAELLAHVGRRMAFLVERLGEPTTTGWKLPERPFASPRTLAAALFPVLAALPPALYLGILVREGLRGRRAGEVRWPAVAAAVAGLAYLPQFLWERLDLAHLQAHLHVAVAVAAVAAAGLAPRLRRAAVAGFAVLAVLGALRVGAGMLREELALYPCCEGRRIGARVLAPPPPWAGLPGADRALVVLGWGPGWYALEGARPATRLLYTGERGLDAEAVAELAADLADPEVRWVLDHAGLTPYPPVLRVLEERYERRGRWREWRLWERSPAPVGRLRPPAAAAATASPPVPPGPRRSAAAAPPWAAAGPAPPATPSPR